MPSLLHLINISVTGTHDLIGRDAECASGFSVAHAHASLNTSSPSYASRPKSAIYASVYRRYLYHQRSPPWCCHILTFAMTEKVSSRSHSGRPWVGVAPVLSPITMEISLINRVLPTYILKLRALPSRRLHEIETRRSVTESQAQWVMRVQASNRSSHAVNSSGVTPPHPTVPVLLWLGEYGRTADPYGADH